MVKVKNKGNQIFIGKTLCPNGRITSVNEQDLQAFCKTPGGAALLDTSLFIYDEDFQKQKEASKKVFKQKAEAEARQKLAPVLEKGIRAKLEKEYAKKIASLESIISDLKKKLETVDDLVSDSDDEKDAFIFDPENHTIEHKGGGRYIITDLKDNQVLDRTISKEEKEQFEAMQKAE